MFKYIFELRKYFVNSSIADLTFIQVHFMLDTLLKKIGIIQNIDIITFHQDSV